MPAPVAGAVIGDATPLGIVGGLLGGDKLFAGGTTDICPAGPGSRARPAGAGSSQEPSKPASPNPGALLKNLFR